MKIRYFNRSVLKGNMICRWSFIYRYPNSPTHNWKTARPASYQI